MDGTIRIAKTKALICVFVFAYAKGHNAAQMIITWLNKRKSLYGVAWVVKNSVDVLRNVSYALGQ